MLNMYLIKYNFDLPWGFFGCHCTIIVYTIFKLYIFSSYLENLWFSFMNLRIRTINYYTIKLEIIVLSTLNGFTEKKSLMCGWYYVGSVRVYMEV